MDTLRITGPSPYDLWKKAHESKGLGKLALLDAGGSAKPTAGQVYTANLAKLIPGEALAVYALTQNISAPPELNGIHLVPIACLVTAIVVRIATTAPAGKKWPPQWPAVIVAALLVPIWIYSNGDWFLNWNAGVVGSYIAKLILLLAVTLVPFYYRFDPTA